MSPPPPVRVLSKCGLFPMKYRNFVLLLYLLWSPNDVDNFHMMKEPGELPGRTPPLTKTTQVGTNNETFHRQTQG